MKDFIDQVNKFITKQNCISNENLLEKFYSSSEEHLLKAILLSSQYLSNKKHLIEKAFYPASVRNTNAFLEKLTLKMESKFVESKKVAAAFIEAFIGFSRESIANAKKINDQLYTDWLIGELENMEGVEVDSTFLQELAPSGIDSMLKFLESDTIIENLECEEMASLALNALCSNALKVNVKQLEELMRYMKIEDEASPLDFMYTMLSESSQDFDEVFLPSLLENPYFKLVYGSVPNLRNFIEELSDSIFENADDEYDEPDVTTPDPENVCILTVSRQRKRSLNEYINYEDEEEVEAYRGSYKSQKVGYNPGENVLEYNVAYPYTKEIITDAVYVSGGSGCVWD